MKKLYTLALAAAAALSVNAQVYFVGEFDGVAMWTPETPLEATVNADGNWEITLEKTGGFKMSTAKGTWEEFNAQAFSVNSGNVTEEYVGKFVDAMAWGENTSMPAQAKWKVEVTPDYTQVRFTQEGEAAAIEAYITGGFADWGFVELWKMTTVEKDKKYNFVCAGETMLPAGEEFKIATPGWTLINYSVGNEALADGESSPAAYNNDKNMFFSADFEGTIELNLINGFSQEAEITFTPGSAGAGVEDVTVENNAKAVYYNLQGVEVANPEAGLYIVRRGDKVSKVLVK